MTCIRTLTALGATLALAACVTEPPPRPAAMIAPGQAKTAVAFQQDQTVCHQQAITRRGYATPTSSPVSLPPVGSAANTATRASAQPTTDTGIIQCMAARGNSLQITPLNDPHAYGSPYPIAYSYQRAYPYPSAYPYLDYTYAYGYPGYGLGLSDALVLGAGGFDPGSSRRGGFQPGGFQRGFRSPGLLNGFNGGGFQNGFRGPGVQNAFFAGGFQNGFHSGGFQNGFRGPGVQTGFNGSGSPVGFNSGGFQNGSGGFHAGGHR